MLARERYPTAKYGSVTPPNAKPHNPAGMLIGAHVSPAGGLPKAIERGVQRGCRAIQIFNQSPRMWKASAYRDEDVAAFSEAMAASPIDAVLIHAVYLVNCASEDPDIREKSLTSLVNSLRAGSQIGACGVVLHPGSAKAGAAPEAISRAGQTIREALSESEGCPLHLENTAGAGGTLGRSLAELAALLDSSGGDDRLGLCLDSCHLFASGYDIRSVEGVSEAVSEVAAKVGLGRVRALHFNDSQAPLGSNRDRHANVGAGELGQEGCAAFLSAPEFDELPCVLETPGEKRSGASAEEVKLAVTLRERGIAARVS
ncbi:MAG: apurinic endonuclease Apn1 [Solirubrobacterales bacterium]|jgi:deoxyribonuclease-4|nr:apurinic endonuclease Apn1 [Solirubrobacterales bacterium]